MRAPLERMRHPGASGPHKGIQPANMPWEIFVACCAGGEGFNAQTYRDLHTVIDLAGLYDIIEGAEVRNSWLSAAERNARPRDDEEDD